MPDRSLTEIERRGLTKSVNLADGHARQTLSDTVKLSLRRGYDEIVDSGATDVVGAEHRFLDALSTRLMTKYPSDRSYVLYSASISVDLAAKLLRGRGLSVHLMVPTFDNLAALVEMNGVKIRSVPEQAICPVVDFDYLDSQQVESLFVVLPNNPTGARLPLAEISKLFDWSARQKVLLILDLSFRYLIPEYATDLLAVADSQGASALMIDDTGKVLSLLDSKMSVVTCTSDLVSEVEQIHEEILLNTSAFEMELLSRCLDPDGACAGHLTAVKDLIGTNRRIIQRTLLDCGIAPVMRPDEEMSVEWVRLGADCEQIIAECANRGLQILPGRLFYWDRSYADDGREYTRIALMRDTEQVQAGCEILRAVLTDLKSLNPV